MVTFFSGTAVTLPSLASATAPSAEVALPGWSPAASLPDGRDWHTANLLGNGDVLVAGGVIGNGFYPTATAELFNPSANSWTAVATMNQPTESASGIELADGRVLVMGGQCNDGPRCVAYSEVQGGEVYNPTTNSWSATGPMPYAVYLNTLTLLTDGRVLAAGGSACVPGSCATTAAAKIYNPATNAWTPAAPMHFARLDAAAELLTNGDVLVAEGSCSTNAGGTCGADPADTAELYDPATNTWTVTSAPLFGSEYP